MITDMMLHREEASRVLQAKDYTQLLTLADRTDFENSLVKDLVAPDPWWDGPRAEHQHNLLMFKGEDVQRRLSCHEQRMLENFARLIDHARIGDLFND